MSRRLCALVPAVLVVGLWPVLCRAAEEATATTAAAVALGDLRITQLVAVITAIGALGTAAFSLVDALKAFWGGVSNVGLSGLRRAVGRYGAALEAALGKTEDGKPEWRGVVRAHWINGRPREEQKAIVKSLIRLGLSQRTAAGLGAASHVSPERLEAVAGKLEHGDELTPADLNILGRLDASVEARLDAAFDRADQLYRNVAQACAGAVAIALAFLVAHIFHQSCWTALIVGLLAVPLAPIAKDLASSLQAAAAAMRAAK